MLKTPIKKIVQDLKACDLPDQCSTARELFIKKHEPEELEIHALDEKSVTLFQELSEEVLPVVLPFGHQWAKSEEGQRSIIKTVDAESCKLEVVVYGPDRGKINYVFLVDGVNWQSFAHTKQGKGKGLGGNKPPMTLNNYRVVGFDYDEKNKNDHRYRNNDYNQHLHFSLLKPLVVVVD